MNNCDEDPFWAKWMVASVFEYGCKKDFKYVVEKVLKDEELVSDLPAIFSNKDLNENRKMKPVFMLTQILQQLLSSVESFATEKTSDCYPWNSDALPNIIKLLEITYEQCEFISLKKFFSLLSQLKFLDLMHLLRFNVESSALMQKLNIHFPRWLPSQKETFEKKFSIENPKILDKVEESYRQCRKLILRLATDSSYRSIYMKQQFLTDMKKMMIDSVVILKEVIGNLTLNGGSTIIERCFDSSSSESEAGDFGYQLLVDYLHDPELSPENLLKFLDEMKSGLDIPTGGFSSCLLPFDTLSECSETPMDSEYESDSESCSEDDTDEKDKTVVNISNEDIEL